MGYTNSPIGYANPDAVTQIANGLCKSSGGATTTYGYDAFGQRVIQTEASRRTGSQHTFSYPALP